MATFLTLNDKENLVAGKVLTLKSGQGIRNLLVVCYDVDPLARLHESLSDVAPPASSTLGRSTLPGEPDNNREIPAIVGSTFWAALPGQRLGSVLTHPSGNWQLSYNTDLFQHNEPSGRLPRPDLMILS